MQTHDPGGVSVDPDALLDAARRLSRDADALLRVQRAGPAALERAADAGPGPVRSAARELAEALRDALRVLQQAESQLAADASTQAWQACAADGR